MKIDYDIYSNGCGLVQDKLEKCSEDIENTGIETLCPEVKAFKGWYVEEE